MIDNFRLGISQKDLKIYYNNSRRISKIDVLNYLYKPFVQNIKTHHNNLILKSRQNTNNVLVKQLNEWNINKQIHMEANKTIPNHVKFVDPDYKEIVKYGLENSPIIINKLLAESGKTFTFVTKNQAFNIKLDAGSIPHLLGIISSGSTEKQETRLYREINSQFRINKKNLLRNLPSNSSKELIQNACNEEYLKTVKNVIIKYKSELFITHCEDDEFDKDLLGKHSYKTCNMDYIIDLFTADNNNSFEVYQATDNTKVFLLIKQIPNTNMFCSLVIIGEGNTYSMYSGGILDNYDYNNLLTAEKFTHSWSKTDLGSNHIVFKCDTIDVRTKKNNRFLSNINEIKNYNLKDKNKEEIKKLETNSKTKERVIANLFNDIIIKNDNNILKEIYSLIEKDDMNNNIDELSYLIIKLFQNYVDESNFNESYYYALALIANKYCQNNELKELINACYTCDIEKINNLIQDEASNDNNVFNISTAVSKCDNEYYINYSLEILTDLNIHNKNYNYNATNSDLVEQIKDIINSFYEIYENIQTVELKNLNDAKKYIKLMNNYYKAFEVIQSTIIDLFIDYITTSTKLENICELGEYYPDTIFDLVDLKASKPSNYLPSSNSEFLQKKSCDLISKTINDDEEETMNKLFSIKEPDKTLKEILEKAIAIIAKELFNNKFDDNVIKRKVKQINNFICINNSCF